MTLQIVIPGNFTAPGLPDLGLLGFEDTFTRGDADSLGYTEIPRRRWLAWAQSLEAVTGIINDAGYVTRSDGAGHAVASVDAGTADGTLEVTIGQKDATSQMGAAFRCASINDYWRFACNGSSYYRLSKYVSGGNVHIAQTTDITPAPGDRLKVVLSGPSIKCFVNDEQVIDASDSDLLDKTRHGFYNNGDSANTFDQIKFTA